MKKIFVITGAVACVFLLGSKTNEHCTKVAQQIKTLQYCKYNVR